MKITFEKRDWHIIAIFVIFISSVFMSYSYIPIYTQNQIEQHESYVEESLDNYDYCDSLEENNQRCFDYYNIDEPTREVYEDELNDYDNHPYLTNLWGNYILFGFIFFVVTLLVYLLIISWVDMLL